MKTYYKQCKNLKEVNSFLRKLNLSGFEFDVFKASDFIGETKESIAELNKLHEEFDFDGWCNEEKIKGVAVQVHTDYEVFVTKYTSKDIEILEKEFV